MRFRPHLGASATAAAKVVRWINRATAVVAAVVAGAIMVAITFDVAYRKSGRGDVPGLLELVETFMIFVVFLGLAHAERTNTHVRVSLVTSALPSSVRSGVRVVALLIAMGGAGWFTWAAFERAHTAFVSHEIRTGLLNFPLWPARFAIVAGFALLMLENAVKLYEHLATFRSGSASLPRETSYRGQLVDLAGERSD